MADNSFLFMGDTPMTPSLLVRVGRPSRQKRFGNLFSAVCAEIRVTRERWNKVERTRLGEGVEDVRVAPM